MAKKAAAKVKKAKVMIADTSQLYLRGGYRRTRIMKGSPFPIEVKSLTRTGSGEWKEVPGSLTKQDGGQELMDICSTFNNLTKLTLKQGVNYTFTLTVTEVK